MDLLELEVKQRLSREQAAAHLHDIADALAKNNEVEFEREQGRITVQIPDHVHLKVEVEIGDDERELEIELTW